MSGELTGASEAVRAAGGAGDGAGAGLVGRLLVAMPEMRDEHFRRAVICVCDHSSEGAMGLVINRASRRMSFPVILEQLGIEACERTREIRVQSGGPVGTGRGFVLHSDEYVRDSTVRLSRGVALTNTVDILRLISRGEGPERSFLALGYAGWGAGQLDGELASNSWLVIDSDPELLFGVALEDRWSAAIRSLGVDPRFVSQFSGRA
ncbi:MAG: YqgE/AlgH family protein [Alphaproteobacteria bacterium]|nr:YqgE/AlgH family protein [Alphaproteobacteria bacterium]MDA8004676.1 YqgE/AlgH family protein [Alphaproteobacteria bacterium]MDA8005501.1 YqgE/AlgH family protein [Alphaproteobacteria bacterium]MDA8013864.1 YqgE/AlgH family protein [Alphaproteobacteria bacterium]